MGGANDPAIWKTITTILSPKKDAKNAKNMIRTPIRRAIEEKNHVQIDISKYTNLHKILETNACFLSDIDFSGDIRL